MGREREFGQHAADIRLDWGLDGLAALAPACRVLVVLDVLSFTTTVDIVLGRGSMVRPAPWAPGHPDPLRRPAAAVTVPARQELVMASPNGATVLAAATDFGHATTFAACLRNAAAVARAAADTAAGAPIGVIPAGERWGVSLAGISGPGTLRPALEDLLGAGAVVAALRDTGVASPEALAAATVFAHTDVAAALRDCVSGRELAAGGHAADVELAAQVDRSSVVPLLREGVLRDAHS
ncbi:MAG: 2-phosphosulfolactate phosphatase [Thermocrispum sp.]